MLVFHENLQLGLPTVIWLFAAKYVVLEPCVTRSAETDIGFCFSEKYVEKMYPRSSMSLKSLFLDGGILDSGYRGNATIILHNLSNNRIGINPGDRIAQVLLQKIKNLQDSLKFQVLMILPQKEVTRVLDQREHK